MKFFFLDYKRRLQFGAIENKIIGRSPIHGINKNIKVPSGRAATK